MRISQKRHLCNEIAKREISEGIESWAIISARTVGLYVDVKAIAFAHSFCILAERTLRGENGIAFPLHFPHHLPSSVPGGTFRTVKR